ncbi:MAG: iron-containing alcohol dehydrogenase [Lentisphaeria bacterium]|nr:iron-containing alcohol dehydrogenase [Lentisphaeria bacterium]
MFTNYIPTKLYFGAGELEKLGSIPLPGKKALIVITNGKSIRANGTLDRVQELLKKNNCENAVFDNVQANPTKDQVMEGAAMAKAENCDFVIGLGGGSPIDSSKAIALMATNPGDLWDYISSGSGKGQTPALPPLPIIAITTTAGTGTEVDPWSVVTHNEEKIGFGWENTFPEIAIVDPELMLTIPPDLTACQGFDAFFHAVECYLANIATPVSELYCLKSIELLAKSLPTAVNDGKNLEARSDVALANTLSGMAESTSCNTSEHAIAHAIGGVFPNIPHGAALLMISKAWFKHYAPLLPERFAAMAKAAGKADFCEVLEELRCACHMENLKMSGFGITREDLKKINDNAWDTMGFLFVLDRIELTKEESLKILEESYS